MPGSRLFTAQAPQAHERESLRNQEAAGVTELLKRFVWGFWRSLNSNKKYISISYFVSSLN